MMEDAEKRRDFDALMNVLTRRRVDVFATNNGDYVFQALASIIEGHSLQALRRKSLMGATTLASAASSPNRTAPGWRSANAGQ